MDRKTVFEPHIEHKSSPIGPQKVKTTPKLSQNQMPELKETSTLGPHKTKPAQNIQMSEFK